MEEAYSFEILQGRGEKMKMMGKDLTEEIKSLGYDYVTTKSEMNESTSDKLWGLFAEKDLSI